MKKLSDKLVFGTAGIPIATKPRNTINGISTVKKLGLGSMELEFVHSVNISSEAAVDVKKEANSHDVVLTCHGQYYINLNAVEKAKIEASKKRVILAARRAHECGAYSMCFHAGFYLKMPEGKVYLNIKKQLSEVISELKNEGIDIWVRPETTGKGTQFGTLDEILKLSQELDNVMPCVDFSHLHARSNGKFNTYEEFCQILEKIEQTLGKQGLKNMHIHASGIDYGEKGEKKHLILKESDLNYKDMTRAWRDFNIRGVVTCESPNIEDDALLLKKTYGGTK